MKSMKWRDRTMGDIIDRKRVEFCICMLEEINQLTAEMEMYKDSILETSIHTFKEIQNSYQQTVEELLRKLSDNVAQICKSKNTATLLLNEWYDFSQNPSELRKITYPIKFMIRKRLLKQHMMQLNLEIDKLLITNRMLKEKVLSSEQEQKNKSTEVTKNDKMHQAYLQHVIKRKELLMDLSYLLTTLPEVCPVEIEVDKTVVLIKKLEGLIGYAMDLLYQN